MKVFIKNCLLFSFLLLTIFTAISYLQENQDIIHQHYQKQYREAFRGRKQYQNIIIGTSQALHSIKPSIIDSCGLSFYNFGLNGANPKFCEQWYNEIYRSYNQPPKHLILTVNWFWFDGSLLKRQFEQDAAYFPQSLFWKIVWNKPMQEWKDLFYNRYAFLKYRSSFKTMLTGNKRSWGIDERAFDRGFAPLYFEKKPNFKEKLTPLIDSNQVVAFKKLLKQLKQENVKVILIFTPEYLLAQQTQYKASETIQLIEKIADENQIPIIDFNRPAYDYLYETKQNYADNIHLNHQGAIKFSQALAEELKKYRK